jgi:hypothetical protein
VLVTVTAPPPDPVLACNPSWHYGNGTRLGREASDAVLDGPGSSFVVHPRHHRPPEDRANTFQPVEHTRAEQEAKPKMTPDYRGSEQEATDPGNEATNPTTLQRKSIATWSRQ